MPQAIQWYPGHIAKAERQLKEQLKWVDVVLEVIDARIPLASQHPQVRDWIGEKPRVLVLNRMDMIPETLRQRWQVWFEAQGQIPYFTDAKSGGGIRAVSKAAQAAGIAMNERRQQRGMRPRPVRAVVMGLPNVGKSALINRLVGKKAVASARRPGVTRQLQWVKLTEHLELLDAPGVIPWRLENQEDALKLAICEDIGEAAYDEQHISAALVDHLMGLSQGDRLKTRYHIDPKAITGEDFLEQLGQLRHRGDKNQAAMQVLNDFRKGVLGAIALEVPPSGDP